MHWINTVTSGFWEFSDDFVGISVYSPCVVAGTVARCAHPTAFLLDFGGGNDALADINQDRQRFGGDPPFTIYGGPGSDQIVGNASNNDYIDAGDDNDTVQPSQALFGAGGAGNDHVLGGNGSDYVDGGDQDDLVEGGPGNDTVYDITGTNRLYGQDGADIVKGHGYMDGGPGNDEVSDDPYVNQRDTLVGGPGSDTINGGVGYDIIEAWDGERDLVSCGPINADEAHVDQFDVVSADCEAVTRTYHAPPGVAGGGGVGGGGGGGAGGGRGGQPVSIFLSNAEAKQAGRRAVRRKFGRNIRGLALACRRQSNVRMSCKARFKRGHRRYWAKVTITARKNSKGQESRRARVGRRHRA